MLTHKSQEIKKIRHYMNVLTSSESVQDLAKITGSLILGLSMFWWLRGYDKEYRAKQNK